MLCGGNGWSECGKAGQAGVARRCHKMMGFTPFCTLIQSLDWKTKVALFLCIIF